MLDTLIINKNLKIGQNILGLPLLKKLTRFELFFTFDTTTQMLSPFRYTRARTHTTYLTYRV
jgi:hypothetical protein